MLGEARRDAPLWLAGDVTGRGKVRASGSILREARGRLSARDPASPRGRGSQLMLLAVATRLLCKAPRPRKSEPGRSDFVCKGRR